VLKKAPCRVLLTAPPDASGPEPEEPAKEGEAGAVAG